MGRVREDGDRNPHDPGKSVTMSGIRQGIRRLFRLALRREDLARDDVDREIRFHLEQRVAALRAAGMSPSDARAEAERRFGDIESTRAELSASAVRREGQLALSDRIDAVLVDLRYVARALVRSRGFSVLVILTFALGIGANAAMFGIIDRLLVRGPEHVVAPERVARLYVSAVSSEGPYTESAFGYVTYSLMRDQARQIEHAAAYQVPMLLTVGAGERASRAAVASATWDFFRLLGVRPAVGRFFTDEEDRPPQGQHVIVLGHDLWQRAFDGDSSIIGKTTFLQGQVHTIVGVAPAGFTGVELNRVDAWVPMSLKHPTNDWPTSWRAEWLHVVARLKPGADNRLAAIEATQLFQRNYDGIESWLKSAELSYRPIGFGRSGAQRPEVRMAAWLAGVASIVLLVACANVANMLLARGLSRRREIALRLALGIDARRLRRLLLLEALTLSTAGSAAGLLLAYWGGSAIRRLLLPNVLWTSGPVDARVFVICAALALACGLAVGLVPLLQARHLALSAALKAGSQQSGVMRSRLRTTLLFAQCALSVVLMAGAGLFVVSLYRAQNVDLGFRPDRVIRAHIEWPSGTGGDDRGHSRDVYLSAMDRLRAVPGVRHTAIAIGTPFGYSFRVDLRVPGRDSIPELGGGGPHISAVTPDYFAVMGTRVLDGRVFEPTDRENSERVAIVNEPMARALWPGERAVGKCMYIYSDSLPCARIVGVVAEMRRDQLREKPGTQYYVPLGQEIGMGGLALMIEVNGSATDVVPRVQRAVRELDPTALFVRAEPLRSVIDPLARQWRLGATLFGVFGALALCIAALGLYSVIAYLVAQRTTEFGIRLALGATRRRIVALVLRNGGTVAVAGLVAGVGIAFLAGRFIQSLLFETSPHDPRVFGTVVLVLLAATVTACLLPAVRATRVDPMEALRAD